MKNGTWLVVGGKKVPGVPRYGKNGKVEGYDRATTKPKPAAAAKGD